MENNIIEENKIKNDENQFPKEINDILNIIYDFFTEENVDCVKNSENYRVIIRFPEVTVTNEDDKSTKVKDLYVKFVISSEYKLLYNFTMVVTTFTKSKWIVGYAHSHLQIISNGNIGFKEPCLGGGPIRGTINYLNYNYDLDYWEMFCLELKKYVETESLEGVPYIRLSSISSNSLIYRLKNSYFTNLDILHFKRNVNKPLQTLINNFIDFLVTQQTYFSNAIKLVNHNGCLVLGESLLSCNIKITNLFVKYINIYSKENTLTNKDLKDNLFIEYSYRNNNMYIKNERNSIFSIPTTPILKFKNKDVYVKILEDDVNENLYEILKDNVFSYIINKVLILINNRNEFSEKQFSII